MAKKLNVAVSCALKRLALARTKAAALQYALQDSNDPRVLRADEQAAYSVLWARVYRELNDAYSHLILVSGLVGGEAWKEAMKQALDHFGGERAAIMHWLDPAGNLPSMWSTKDEEQLRAEIAAAAGRF